MLTWNNIFKEVTVPSNKSLVLATVWIITEVFHQKSRGSTLIGLYANTKSAYVAQSDMVEDILKQITRTPITRFLLEGDKAYDSDKKGIFDLYRYLNDEEYFYRLDGYRDKAIWLIDSLDSFKRLLDDLLNERNNYYRNGIFCIVYTGQEKDRLKIIQVIFRRLFRIYVINVNVLLQVGHTVYVYTYFPFSKKRCHNVQPEFYGMFSPVTNYRYSRRRFFPKKLLNMWQCKVKVTTWTVLPFIKMDYNNTTKELISLEGIEGRLMMLLSERMNFSIQIVEEPNRKAGNGTDPGAIKMLKDAETNITIFCLLYDKGRLENAQPAYSYFNVPYNLAIPLGDTMTPLERLVRPFKYIIWSCLSSSVLFGISVIFLLKLVCNRKVQDFVFGFGNQRPFTNLFNVFYGVPITGRLPRRNFARYLLGVWILYTFVLRSAYLAQLFLILQDSRARSELNTVNETLEKNFTIHSYPIAAPILAGASSKPVNVKILNPMEGFVAQLLEVLAKDENAKFAVALPWHFIQAFNQEPQNHKQPVNILQETIMHAPVTFYMRKHSYLTHEVDELLLNIMSAGLISKFEELSLSRRVYTRETEGAVPIPIDLLSGLFAVYIVLLMLSCLVFLLEIWSKRSPITRKVLDFFNL